MSFTSENTVADIVSTNSKTADVFKKYGIDFCCGGGISIEKVCEKRKINTKHLIAELELVCNTTKPELDYNNWELDFLADYIINVHHKYVTDAIELLDNYSNIVVKVHGNNHPIVTEVAQLYLHARTELLLHMQKEENILFPYIKNMVHANRRGLIVALPHFGSVQNPIKMMNLEHEHAGEIFKKIAELTYNYMPPEWACNTIKVYFSKLQEFEQNLHLHVHLENNILFPKAIQLEKLMAVTK